MGHVIDTKQQNQKMQAGISWGKKDATFAMYFLNGKDCFVHAAI